MEDNKITFVNEDGEQEEFFVVEETKINGISYLLVCEDMSDETDAYILKDVSDPSDLEATYEFVEDDDEINAVADIFAELLEDEDLI